MPRIGFTFLLIFVLQGSFRIGDGNLEKQTTSRRLKEYLLKTKNYDPTSRPVRNHTSVTDVNLNLAFVHLNYLNSSTHILSATTWFALIWKDEFLTWDTKDYNLSYLIMHESEVWHPDVVLYDPTFPPMQHIETNVYAFSSGSVLWVPPVTIFASCSMDLTNFPYDKHNCSIPLGSWTYDLEELNITGKARLESSNSAEWIVKNYSVERHMLDPERGTYPFLKFQLVIARKSDIYYYTLILPTAITATLTLLMLWLPVTSYKKVSLGCFNMLLLLYLLNQTADLISGSTFVPKLVTILGTTFLIQALATLCEVVVLHIANTASYWILPELVQKVMSQKIVQYLCFLCVSIPEEASKEEKQDADSSEPRKDSFDGERLKWILAAQACDRVLFLVFTAVLLVNHSL